MNNVLGAEPNSNLKMKSIPLTKGEGTLKDSVIKPDLYFHHVRRDGVKVLFHIAKKKKSCFLIG